MEIDPVGLLFFAVGIATLAAAILPRFVGRVPISFAMVFVAAGVLTFTLFPDLPDPNPVHDGVIALHLTEVCVIVSLMGAGLAVNRRIGWRSWSSTWRLLGITMPLSMIAVGLLGWGMLGLGVAGAVLIAAALAPTDPVLATEVQVSEPIADDEAEDDEARFAITSEAGLNDGLAFPFVYAAIAISIVGLSPVGWLGNWLAIDIAWRLAIGVITGMGVGWLLGRLFFSSLAERLKFAEHAEGFVALAATFLAYGVAEVLEGYGFIAVFVCALTVRAAERAHGYHAVLHKFVEQIERLLTMTVLVFLGGAIARGLFASLGWEQIVVALLIVIVIRPLAGWAGLTPGKTGPRERFVIAFFGVRGIGSLFYIAFALENGEFPRAEELWATVSLVIVASILIHGITATPVMAIVDRKRRLEARRLGQTTEATPV